MRDKRFNVSKLPEPLPNPSERFGVGFDLYPARRHTDNSDPLELTEEVHPVCRGGLAIVPLDRDNVATLVHALRVADVGH